MRLLTRESVKEVQDLPTKEVIVPEWNGKVLVRGLTAAERDTYQQEMMQIHEMGGSIKVDVSLTNAKTKLVCMCVVDEKGERVFRDEDVSWLGNKSASAINRIADVIAELSGMTQEVVSALGKGSGKTTRVVSRSG